ncbi:MAG: hypothetical protein EVA45_03905 [Flavobacteriales bacterium]|nr:MAG: hypothetical protein EVA45_03905 [Flavobacteriales bacterium]
MKKYFYVFLVLWGCNLVDDRPKDIKDYIPENSLIIIKIHNLGKFKSDIKNNEVLNKIGNSKYNTKKQLELINNLNDETELIISLTKNINEEVFTIITKDSIKEFDVFHKRINNINIYSNSLKNINEIQINYNKDFNKYAKTFNVNDSFSLILKEEISKEFLNSIFNLNNKIQDNSLSFGVNIFNDKILLNGLSFLDDSLKLSNNIFKGSISSELKNYEITPKNITSLKSYNFKNLNNYLKKASIDEVKENRFSVILNNNSIEITEIKLDNEQVFIFRLDEIKLFKDYLINKNTISTKHRGFEIYNNTDLDINPFISFANFNNKEKILLFKDYLVFSNNEKTLKQFINDNLNKNTLKSNSSFNRLFSSISSFNTLNNNYFSGSNYNFFNELNLLNSKNDFTENSFQLVQDNGIIHFNAVISKDTNEDENLKISKLFDVEIDEEIIMYPHFVKNHVTKNLDIVVQDTKNNLYLISKDGKVIWKKKINQPILGQISQIDIYKNGRLQLIFNTKNKIYVLDRNGNNVKQFPKTFNDPITQPLAVFDYDNNKNYRLLVTQGSELLMYDKNGKKVSGFKYKKSSNNITSKPKHFRILNKDFIVFKIGNKMKILNRKGRERINVNDDINFSNQNVFEYNDKLISTTTDQKLVQIDVNGVIDLSSLKNLSLNSDGSNLVVLDENSIKLSPNIASIPFGNYGSPQLSNINKNLLITLYDKQNKKSYLFNKNLILDTSFPVYSLIPMEIGDMNRDKKIELIISNKNKFISCYTIN